MDTAVNNKPKDPDYFKKYYQNNNKGVMMECPRCHRQTSKVNLSKHMKRNICLVTFVAEMVNKVVDTLGIQRPEIPDTSDHENEETT